MTYEEPSASSPREEELAQKMMKALSEFTKDYSGQEGLTALVIVIMDIIRHSEDPDNLVEGVCDTLRANFPPRKHNA
jgi:hypothetical protein